MWKAIGRIVSAAALILCASVPAIAQCTYTSVTATISDPNGVPYSFANISADLVPSPPGGPLCTGNISFPGHQGPIQTTSAGTFTMLVPANAAIIPSGTTWKFTVGMSPGVALPFGTGPQSFSGTVTVSGSSQNISTTLNALAPALTLTCCGGSGTNILPLSNTFTGTLNTFTNSVAIGTLNVSGNAIVTGTLSVSTLGTGEVCSFLGALSNANCIFYDVRSYGAKVDGSTDDTAAWAACVTAASATGGVCWMPGGTSRSCTIAIPSTVGIAGEARVSSIIKETSGCNAHLVVPATSASTQNIAVAHLTLDGNVSGQTSGGAFDIINLANTGSSDRYYYVEDVSLQNATEDSLSAPSGRGGMYFHNVRSEAAGRYAYYIANVDDYMDYVYALTCGQTCFRVIGSNIQIVWAYAGIAGSSTPTNGDGFYFAGTRNMCAGCQAQDNYRNGFFFTGSDSTFTGLMADGNNRGFNTIGSTASGITDFGSTNSIYQGECTDYIEGATFPVLGQTYCLNISTGTGNSWNFVSSNERVGDFNGGGIGTNNITINGITYQDGEANFESNVAINNSGAADNVIDFQTNGTSQYKWVIPGGSTSFAGRDFANSFNFLQYFPGAGNLYLASHGTGALIINNPVAGTGGGTGGVQVSSGGSSPVLWDQFNLNIATLGHLNQLSSNHDIAGSVTITNPATSASASFTNTFSNGPSCTLGSTASTAATGTPYYNVTTGAITIFVPTTPASTITISYHCIGNPN